MIGPGFRGSNRATQWEGGCLVTSESVVPILAVIVTCFGFMLGVGGLLFILMGTKVPAQPKGPHRIKFRDLEVQTDRVVMLLIVSVLAMVLPFSGYMWLSTRELHNLQFNVVATIEEGPGIPARNATVSLVRLLPGGEEPLCPERRTTNGMFSCASELSSLHDRFELRVQKPGYFDHIKRVIPTQPDLVVTLQKEQ